MAIGRFCGSTGSVQQERTGGENCARLLARPAIGRLADVTRQQQLKLVSSDEPFRFVGGMALLKK